MKQTLEIALLGCGIVGSGVAKILTDQRDLLRQRTGHTFNIRHIVVRDPSKTREALPVVPTRDANAALNDPDVDVYVELIGGTTVAGEYLQRALHLGKPVVTANKSLLAARGPELFALARKQKTCIAFEASCGGGIPIIDALTRGLLANRIDALVGIVNGTCNFILTKMTKEGATYADALKEAQAAGFAEADPTLDVSGRDAAQKLALLAGLAFNAHVTEQDIHIEGIDTLQAADIGFASELGYVIKLLAIAERSRSISDASGKLSLRVHPTLVHKSDVLAEVGGSFNAISIYGHALGHSLFYGRGAGQMPTASAVVADLIGVAMGTTQLAFSQLNIFPDVVSRPSIMPVDERQSRYYLRLAAKDQPGVLAQVTKALGDNGISLSAILQHEENDTQRVPVVITTHRASEGAIRGALKTIDALPTIQPPTVCLRIIDQPAEF